MVTGTQRFPACPLCIELRPDWRARFGEKVPLEVEIGFGYGHFLLEYARRRPDMGLVGFETRKAFTKRLTRRANRLGIQNVELIRGDARKLLPVLFEPKSISAVHVQFPDPWWKKRHQRRRLIDGYFVTLVHNLLAPGGLVFLRTDVLDYGRTMMETFEDGTHRFENVAGQGSFIDDDGLGVPSNRERRYLAAGTPVYRLVYKSSNF